MLFFSSIMCGDISTPAMSPTAVNDIDHITIGGAYIDDLYVTEDTSVQPSSEVPSEWDNNTIMHATFDYDSLSAGNVRFKLDDVIGSYILIKRRQADSYHWITLQAYSIHSEEDLKTMFVDYTAAPHIAYEYAAVPIIDNTEGDYYSSVITPDTNRLVVLDKDALWATIVTNGFADSQRNTNPVAVDTMNNKYPTAIHNGIANYDTVTVTAGWFPTDEDNCNIVIGPEFNGWVAKYAKKFMDFLTNRKIKMLKNVDGRMWLCYVTTFPSNNARDVYYDREITFGVTELGDVESEKVLYDAGLIGAGEEWWSSE